MMLVMMMSHADSTQCVAFPRPCLMSARDAARLLASARLLAGRMAQDQTAVARVTASDLARSQTEMASSMLSAVRSPERLPFALPAAATPARDALARLSTASHELLFGPSSPFGHHSATRGKPVGALYMLGTPLNKHCVPLRATHDCNSSRLVGQRHYWAGPPQALHVDDLTELLPLWLKDTRRRVQQDQETWAVDMPAYIVAAASLGLRHGISPSLFVSNAHMSCRNEAWQSVHTDASLCAHDDKMAQAPQVQPLIHFCQFYTTAYDFPEPPGTVTRKVPGRCAIATHPSAGAPECDTQWLSFPHGLPHVSPGSLASMSSPSCTVESLPMSTHSLAAPRRRPSRATPSI